jgi:hypothetical protein
MQKSNKQATFEHTQSHQQALQFAACHNTQVVPSQRRGVMATHQHPLLQPLL